MTKELLPSQIGCIDLEWLEKRESITEKYLNSDLILKHEIEGVNNMLHLIRIVKSQLFPLTPLLGDAWSKGSIHRDYLNKGSKWDGLKPIDRNDYMVSPIKINTNERDKNK